MAKPSKAYILYCDLPISMEYRETAALSCDSVNLPYEYFEGYVFKKHHNLVFSGAGDRTIYVGVDPNLHEKILWSRVGEEIGRPIQCKHSMAPGAAAATAGHILMWDKIYKNKETAVILEHDAVLFYKPDINIPKNKIVALGYKSPNLYIYDYKKAGPPKTTTHVERHSGAHAYALHWRTAEKLLDEVEQKGITEAVDNRYFMREKERFANFPDKITSVPLHIMDPTPALGWLRRSTIWGESANWNYELIDSYKQHLDMRLWAENTAIKL